VRGFLVQRRGLQDDFGAAITVTSDLELERLLADHLERVGNAVTRDLE